MSTTGKPEIAVAFPQGDTGNDAARVRAFAEAAEALGYARITFVDHVLGAPATTPGAPAWTADYTVDKCIHEPMTLTAFIAALTTRIGLLTANIILPQRQAVLVAKQAAEVDVLSGGRLTLGVGLGWNRLEFDALDMEFTSRGKRIGEQVDVMRRLWCETAPQFDGEWHSFGPGGINPRPVQQPIPVWFGAWADAAVRRAARLSDGWMIFPRFDEVADAYRKMELFRETAAELGRDPALTIDATVFWGDGDIELWQRTAETWLSKGATTLTLRVRDVDGGIDGHIAAMRTLMESY